MLKTVGFPSTRTGDQTIVNGNLVIGTAGKGIDFSADPSAPGMTSELLDDYEEGTWTPTITSTSGALTSYTSSGFYTKVGRTVTVQAAFTITNPGTASGQATVAGYPFTSINSARLAGISPAREIDQTGVSTYIAQLANNAAQGSVSLNTGAGIVWGLNYTYAWSFTYQTP
ncbi:hypothetical protein UFOVP768_32 [uncultured Caudovirales phage]|uniref:Uncharacterized protein n=1 Tax=uncultured Caudovirales phage TaxID=2100421 RepID=A0A6J5NVD4_9CAUD|nr:hypothetical protein UFOVP320_30 [uncultured Caudovirales phage]CAB4161045.1 hypothetical protein UFOVP768_32 [uncultured Caudovirales phage]